MPFINEILLDRNVCIDLTNSTLTNNGLIIEFPKMEFRILERLIQNLGSPVSKSEIINYAWSGGHIDYKELYVYINRIRNKLEHIPSKPRYLLAVRGFGYVLYPYINQDQLTLSS